MSIMDQKITTQSTSGKIINTTSSISNITHNNCFHKGKPETPSEHKLTIPEFDILLKDVWDDAAVCKETFWEL